MEAPKKQKPTQGPQDKPAPKKPGPKPKEDLRPRYPCPDWCTQDLWDAITEIRQQAFILEYMIDHNGRKAAIRSGYTDNVNAATVFASELLAKPNVKAVVSLGLDYYADYRDEAAKMVVNYWQMMATGNANELSELRRIPCRYCYSEDNQYQFTPAEFEREKLKWEEKRERAKTQEKPDPGEFPGLPGNWYDQRKKPNEECPECFGNGVEYVFLKDTRDLSPAARAMYGGVKRTKEGIEVMSFVREKALDSLARHLGMYKDKLEVETTNKVDSATLDAIYERALEKAEEGRQKVEARKGAVE
jgi:phage terminase small subunit